MDVFAYCSADYAKSMRKVAGVAALLSPPVAATNFKTKWLEGNDLLFFKLYGEEEQPYWMNSEGYVALDAQQVKRSNLKGAVVFVANCYLPESPMLAALLKAGASAVVGGSGYNYFRRGKLDGVDLLGLHFRLALRMGATVDNALRLAKWRLRLRLRNDLITRDTLDFQVWRKGDDDENLYRVRGKDAGNEPE